MPSLAHKIRLIPNKTQRNLLAQAAGTARYVYNWALVEWRKQYEEVKAGKLEAKPNWMRLSRQWTKEKPKWAKSIFSGLQKEAIHNVNKAYVNWWRELAKGNKNFSAPTLKKKSASGSFYVDNAHAAIKGNRVRLPNIGWIKLRETPRFSGKIMSYSVSYKANCWFVSVQTELDQQITRTDSESVVGIDVGIKNIAVASDGTTLANPKFLAQKQIKLAKYQRMLARQIEGSKRYKRTNLHISKIHSKVVNQRQDAVHKFTATVAKNHSTAVVETLNVAEMKAKPTDTPTKKNQGKRRSSKYIRKALQDTCMREVHRQLEYKMKELIKAPQFYPSSKTCSHCGNIKSHLSLSERMYKCQLCGFELDRDLNAAINLRNRPWVTGSLNTESSRTA